MDTSPVLKALIASLLQKLSERAVSSRVGCCRLPRRSKRQTSTSKLQLLAAFCSPLPSSERRAVHYSLPRTLPRRRPGSWIIIVGVCSSHVTRPITQRTWGSSRRASSLSPFLFTFASRGMRHFPFPPRYSFLQESFSRRRNVRRYLMSTIGRIGTTSKYTPGCSTDILRCADVPSTTVDDDNI